MKEGRRVGEGKMIEDGWMDGWVMKCEIISI